MPWITWSDARLGLRLMKKQPVVATTSVVALAIGIGVAATGFAALDALLFGELPFAGGDRFVRFDVRGAVDGRRAPADLDGYALWQEAESFVHIGAGDGEDLNMVLASGHVESLRGAFITPSTFAHLPYRPVVGRSLVPADAAPGAAPVVVLRESLWHRRFGAAPDTVGSVVNVDGIDRTVVGVLGDDAGFPAGGELWLPLDDRTLGGTAAGPRPGLTYFGILRAGTGLDAAEAEVTGRWRNRQTPADASAPTRVRLVPYVDVSPREAAQASVLVVVLVLLVAVVAANVANLVLARTAARTSELAVRTVLGAPRARLASQLALEVAMLGMIAAALGLAGARAAIRFLDGAVDEKPFWMTFDLSLRTALFVVAVALVATLISGLWPALRATRRDSAAVLQASGRPGAGFAIGRLGAVLMAVELALSVALLSGALVFVRGLDGFLDQAPDLPHGRVLTARLVGARQMPRLGSAQDGRGSGIATLPADEIARALRAIPDVVAVGLTSDLPGTDAWPRLVEVAPENGERRSGARRAPVAYVRPGFLETLDARVVAGRLLRDTDLAAGVLPVAVVNEPFVRTFLGGRYPIGRRLRVLPDDGNEETAVWHEIVGVVPDLGLSAADPALAGGVYLPWSGAGRSLRVALLAAGPPAELAGALRQAITGIDPSIRIGQVVPLEEVGAGDRTLMAAFGRSLSALGVVTLLLSAVCVYAMISFAVSRRTHEIGLRVALGASRVQVLSAVVSGVGRIVIAGGVSGAGLAFALIAVADRLFEIRLPTGEPWVVPAVVLAIVMAGTVAGWVPVRRALRIAPIDALRFD